MTDPAMVAVIAAAAASQKSTSGKVTPGGFLFALMAYFSAAMCVVFVVQCLVRWLR